MIRSILDPRVVAAPTTLEPDPHAGFSGALPTEPDELELPQVQAKEFSGPWTESHPDVLVVEDDEDEVRIIHRALRRHGLESRFKIVRTGADALAYLREAVESESDPVSARPRVVLLDLKLDDIDGVEVLRRVRSNAELATLPVVIVSSSRSEREVRECYRAGANSFVTKEPGVGHPGDRIVEIARYWLELNRTPSPA